MSDSFREPKKPEISILTYVFKEGSPKIQVLLNFIKSKNDNTLVKVLTDKNGYTTVTITTTNVQGDNCQVNCVEYNVDGSCIFATCASV